MAEQPALSKALEAYRNAFVWGCDKGMSEPAAHIHGRHAAFRAFEDELKDSVIVKRRDVELAIQDDATPSWDEYEGQWSEAYQRIRAALDGEAVG